MKLALPAPTPSLPTTPAGERILDAATRLFYLRGINRTGVDLVADRAGVTKRTLYQRFGSKDALVAAYLRRRAHTWQTYVVEGFADAVEPAVERFYSLLDAWVADNPRGCAFANAWVEIDDRRHPALAVIRDEKRWMRELFTVFAQGDQERAESLYLVYEGAQVSAHLSGSTSPFDAALRLSVRLLADA